MIFRHDVRKHGTHWYSYAYALRQNDFASILFAPCRFQFRRSLSQRPEAALRRVLVKCGLNAGGSVAISTAWNYCGNYPRNDPDSITISDIRHDVRTMSRIGANLC